MVEDINSFKVGYIEGVMEKEALVKYCKEYVKFASFTPISESIPEA